MEEQLAEAEAALHQLLTGAKVVEVSKADGSKVKFNAADRHELRTYIADLNIKIAGDKPKRRAIGVHF